jgi:E1A/CREB-binding protein
VFNSPVDPVELGLPDYFEVIKNPMDLGTVKKRLENGLYRSINEVEVDINLTFDNAMLYNPEGSVVWSMAKELKDKFVDDFAVLMTQLYAEEEEKRKNGDACSLCGCEKLLFEPPVFYCNGLTCRSKRIRRNSYFFVGGNNQYHWCQPCFDDMKDNQKLELADMTLTKNQLDKKKNNEVPEESWVQCDRCERWIHQICALFNTRQNKDQRSEFVCPSCTIEDREKKNKLEPSSTTPMAEDLPRTKLSEHLEKHVREKFHEEMARMAKERSEKEVSSLFWYMSAIHIFCRSF